MGYRYSVQHGTRPTSRSLSCYRGWGEGGYRRSVQHETGPTSRSLSCSQLAWYSDTPFSFSFFIRCLAASAHSQREPQNNHADSSSHVSTRNMQAIIARKTTMTKSPESLPNSPCQKANCRVFVTIGCKVKCFCMLSNYQPHPCQSFCAWSCQGT